MLLRIEIELIKVKQINDNILSGCQHKLTNKMIIVPITYIYYN